MILMASMGPRGRAPKSQNCVNFKHLLQIQKWNHIVCTPFKKVTQHHFDQWYQSVYGFISIMLGIIWKLDYLSFHWYFICYDCFAGTCAGRLNWVQCQKINVAKLDHNFSRVLVGFNSRVFTVFLIDDIPIEFHQRELVSSVNSLNSGER